MTKGPAALIELFDRCVVRKSRSGGYEIKCRLGLWGVQGPDRESVEAEAMHYWKQYYADGEYQNIYWHDVKTDSPPLRHFSPGLGWSDKRYVLAVDAKGRMSIGFATEHSSVPFIWTFAKPIGEPTHWMELPKLPSSHS